MVLSADAQGGPNVSEHDGKPIQALNDIWSPSQTGHYCFPIWPPPSHFHITFLFFSSISPQVFMTSYLHHFPSFFSVRHSAGFISFFEVLQEGNVWNLALNPVSTSVDLPSLSVSASNCSSLCNVQAWALVFDLTVEAASISVFSLQFFIKLKHNFQKYN